MSNKKMFSLPNQQNQGFSVRQKAELKELMSDYFINAFREVMAPYMDVQQDRWTVNDKRWEENKKRWEENDKVHANIMEQLQHMERMMNAHTIELDSIDQKLGAFIDRSAQHDDRICDHEKRISHLETISIS